MVILYKSMNRKMMIPSFLRMIYLERVSSKKTHPTLGDQLSFLSIDDAVPGRPTKYYVDDVEVSVATERVQYLDADGRLITESLKDYTRKTIRKAYTSLNAF